MFFFFFPRRLLGSALIREGCMVCMYMSLCVGICVASVLRRPALQSPVIATEAGRLRNHLLARAQAGSISYGGR